MPERVNIGAVGVGGHGRAMLNAIRDAGNLELSACFDVDLEASRETAATLDVPCCSSLDELLSVRDIEAVSVVVPNHLHAGIVASVASAGKACFVEKPIANTVEDGERMIEACRANRVLLSVGHNFRRLGEIRKAKAIIEKGRLGDVVAAEGNLSRPGETILSPDDWRRDEEKCPMPPMMQLGIHLVDAFLYLFGTVQRVSALAHPPAPHPETAVWAALLFSSGLVGSVGSNYFSKERWSVRIFGTEANLYLESNRVVLESMKDPPRPLEFTAVDTLAEELREFGEAFQGRATIEVDGAAGLEALRVVRAVITSVREGSTVDIKS